LFGLGVAYQIGDQTDDAVRYYIAALEQNSNSAKALTNLAGLHTKNSAFADAEKCFRKLVAIEEENPCQGQSNIRPLRRRKTRPAWGGTAA